MSKQKEAEELISQIKKEQEKTTANMLRHLNKRLVRQHFNSMKEFHKDMAKLPYEEKVAQVIELQKIDAEFSKHRNEKRPAYKHVWNLGVSSQ